MSYIEISPYDGWYEFSIEDFCERICPHFGLSVCPEDVSFSGFWSQGDGASFTGLFYLSDVSLANLKADVPTEVELHDLVEELAELATAHPEIQGSVTRLSSRYSHSNTMIIGEWSSNNSYCDEHTEAFASADAETTLLSIFRQLADWLYRRLEEEYNYQLAGETAQAWSEAVEERMTLQGELEQIREEVATDPPKSVILSNALTTAIENLEVEVEDLTSKIEQLADQFHYWSDNKPMSIKDFYENYL